MDARVFDPARMNLAADVLAKPPRYRSERLARWHAARQAAAK
jgi:hypothetical protein